MSDHGVIPRVTELRDFIWTHWRERRRGYVSYTWSHVDSSVIWHIFIEPADSGAWHITLLHFLSGVAHWETFDEPEVVAVERTQPTEEDVHGGNDVLVLKGQDGKGVLRL